MSKIGGWEYDVKTKKTTWTEEVYRIHGLPKEFDTNNVSKCIEFYTPQDRPAIEHAFYEAVENGVPYELELQFISAEGSNLWVRTIGKPIVQNGRIIKVVGYIMDITDLKRSEQDLLEKEEKYRTIFDNTGTAMLIIEEDTTVSLVNDEMLKLVGYTREEFGVNMSWTKFVAKDDLERMREYHSLRRVNPDEAPKSYEFKLIDRYGKMHETFLTISMIPGTKRSIVSLQDVTLLREAEKKIAESERRYRSIFDNAVEGIFQTTSDGKILTLNMSAARMFGYDSPEEMISSVTSIGKQLYVNADDREKWKRVVEQHGEVKNFEISAVKKDGGYFWAVFNARVVKDRAGRISYYEGTIEDITYRKNAEESLKQTLAKLRKSLAGTIQAMSLTVESKDPYTAGHQRRVSSLARSIAFEMKLPNDTIDNIRMAGNVHDIGKISVPAEILVKPTKLSDIEMSLIKVHSQSGYNILKDVELPYPIAEMVHQHHERLDGSGYPQGLKADQILLESKILSVADVVEAIATNRPYRPALGIDAALSEIEKNKGILYDIEVVDVCVRLFKERKFKFE